MSKNNKTKCSKCRKKVDAIVKDDGELICPICSSSIGFIVETTSYNYFVEMVQVYLDHKGIKAKAIINEDGLLDIHINFDTENHQQLADLLSKCMPISYVITNSAIKKDVKAIDRTSGKKRVKGRGKRRKTRKQIAEGQSSLGGFLK